MRKSTRVGATGVFVIALAGAATAVAGVVSDNGVSDRPGGPSVEASPKFAVNSAGQTFGRGDGALRPQDEPDLILAEGTNGKVGYVLKSSLDAATGANVSNPAEALEWEKNKSDAVARIPVYESDGVTQIGWFEVVPTVGEAVTES